MPQFPNLQSGSAGVHNQDGWHAAGRAAQPRADSDLFTYGRTFCSTYLTRHLSVCLKPGAFPLGQAGHAGMFARETARCSVHPQLAASEESKPFHCHPAAEFTLKSFHVCFAPFSPSLSSFTGVISGTGSAEE